MVGGTDGGRKSSSSRKMFFVPVADYFVVEEEEEGMEGALAVTLPSPSETALPGTSASIFSSIPPLSSMLDEDVEDAREEEALAALPWRRLLFCLRGLQLKGDTIQEVRLVFLKRPVSSPLCYPHLSRSYRLYIGEISMRHVTAPTRKEERLPSLRRSLPLPLQRPTTFSASIVSLFKKKV